MSSLTLPAQSARDVLVGAVAAGLTAHQIFKRYEPEGIPAHAALLVLPPALFASLLASYYAWPFAILAAFGTYLATLVLSVLTYRLSPFHPLARYPGPVALKLSKLTMSRIASTGQQHKYIKALHEKYGDAVRTGPNEVSIRHPDAIAAISTLPKGPRWINGKMAFSKEHSLIAEPDTHKHTLKRKPWNRAFNTAALKGYEETIAKRITELANVLAIQKGPTDLGKWLGHWSFDFMSDVVFGGGSEMMRDGDSGSKWHIISEGQAASHVLAHLPWAAYYVRRLPSVAGKVQVMMHTGSSLASQRLKNGSLRRDLFYYLNNEDGAEPTSPSFGEVVSNGTLAMIAGSDTTSVTLTNLFYFVLKDPEIYRRLQAEVDQFFPPGENALDTSQHPNMPFLNAVINETLRLVPVVPDGSGRRVPKGSGGRLAGPYYLPEETVAYIHFYSLQRDPRYFSPHPESFWPDRWLLASAPAPPPGFVHNPAAFVPFSFGPNNCVGKGLALQEMRMLASHLVQRFELRLQPGWDPRAYEEGLMDWFVIEKPELPVVLEPRPQA